MSRRKTKSGMRLGGRYNGNKVEVNWKGSRSTITIYDAKPIQYIRGLVGNSDDLIAKSVAESHDPTVEPDGGHPQIATLGYTCGSSFHHLANNRRFRGLDDHGFAAPMPYGRLGMKKTHLHSKLW